MKKTVKTLRLNQLILWIMNFLKIKTKQRLSLRTRITKPKRLSKRKIGTY